LGSADEFDRALERTAREGKSGTENCAEHEGLFWKLSANSPVEVGRQYGGTCNLHIHGRNAHTDTKCGRGQAEAVCGGKPNKQ
jgi:hypothetical protein